MGEGKTGARLRAKVDALISTRVASMMRADAGGADFRDAFDRSVVACTDLDTALRTADCAEAIAEALRDLFDYGLDDACDTYDDRIGYVLTDEDYHNLRALVGAWERAKAAAEVKS